MVSFVVPMPIVWNSALSTYHKKIFLSQFIYFIILYLSPSLSLVRINLPPPASQFIITIIITSLVSHSQLAVIDKQIFRSLSTGNATYKPLFIVSFYCRLTIIFFIQNMSLFLLLKLFFFFGNIFLKCAFKMNKNLYKRNYSKKL